MTDYVLILGPPEPKAQLPRPGETIYQRMTRTGETVAQASGLPEKSIVYDYTVSGVHLR